MILLNNRWATPMGLAMRSRVVAAVAAVLVMSGALVGTLADRADARQQSGAIDSEGAPASHGDRALIAALEAAGVTQHWIDATAMSPQVALAEVRGGASYQAERQVLIGALVDYAVDRSAAEARRSRVDELDARIETIAGHIRLLRRNAATTQAATDTRAAPTMVSPAPAVPHAIDGRAGWSVGFDPLALAERRLQSIQQRLSTRTDAATPDGLSRDTADAKAQVAVVVDLTRAHREVLELGEFVRSVRQQMFGSELELVARRGRLVESMNPLASRRVLASTTIDGLPIVVVDAYVRAASTLDPSCPVDWTLLAGIGRVESFHGTIGGATVQANGRISQTILGPLLDGGATEREAREAVARAEAEAAALAQAELDAELAEREAEEERLRRDLYGQQTSPEPAPDAVPDAAPDGAAAGDFDPLLWGTPGSAGGDAGDSSSVDADRAASEERDSEDATAEHHEVPELRGNGFAVITDTDNGRLDGNARWDRAVGPMQFIPETWAYWGADGNGDGITDPHNLYDAAAGAGRFLCHLSRTRGSSPRSFVLGYNQSDSYVEAVLQHAASYAATPLPTPQVTTEQD